MHNEGMHIQGHKEDQLKPSERWWEQGAIVQGCDSRQVLLRTDVE